MSTSAVELLHRRLMQMNDETFLANVLVVVSPSADNDNALDDLIPSEPETPASAPFLAHLHFQATRLTLRHLLGNGIEFPYNIPATSHKILSVYCSNATHALVATVLEVTPGEIDASLVHAFFARLAWINDSGVTSPTAKAQLEHLLYEVSPLNDQASLLGTGQYSELGDLLKPVPEDLHMWMLQFKHGLRWQAAEEWLTHGPIDALLQGLVCAEPDPQPNVLASLARVIEQLLPCAGGYRDEPLADSLALRLADETTKQFIQRLIQIGFSNDQAIHTGQTRQLEWHIPLEPKACRQLFARLTLAALGASEAPWVALALHRAAQAPGVQAFSFAAQLLEQHPQLSGDCCLRMGSLLLAEPSPKHPAPLEPLSNAQTLCDKLPAFTDWCAHTSADALFAASGLALLCEVENGQPYLNVPPHEAWQTMMQSSPFTAMFQPLLYQVGWYHHSDNLPPSPRATQALAARAIAERFLGPGQGSTRSIERDFRDRWATELSHQELQAHINGQIVARNPGISPAASRLLEYLLLRDIAPELLVNQVPDWLYYGRSLQSVSLIHGARLLEAILPGAACDAAFDELVTLPQALSSSQDPEIRQLWSQALVVPALRYALAHDAIDNMDEHDLRNASNAQIEAALDFLKQQQEAFASDAQQLSASVPDRQSLAEEQLRQAGLSPAWWDMILLSEDMWAYLKTLGLERSATFHWDAIPKFPVLAEAGKHPMLITLLQLVTMGEVNRPGLPTVPELYATAFDAYQTSWLHAKIRIVKRLFEELPARHRAHLHESTCETSLVAFGSRTGSDALFLRCLSNDHREDFDEHNATAEHFFELIPGAGIVRPCEQQFQYVKYNYVYSGDAGEANARELAYKEAKRKARQTPLLAFDSDAYLQGAPSRSRPFSTPRKGKLIPATTLVYGAQRDEGDFLLTLATAAATHLYEAPLKSLRQTHTHPTSWEQLARQEKQIEDFINRLLVPFYGCTKDLADGDQSAGVIVGCAVDAVAMLIPVGVFARSQLRMIKTAGKLTVRAIYIEMADALADLTLELARQSPAMLLKDLARGGVALSRNAWTSLKKLTGPRLKELLHDLPFLRLTRKGMYCLPPTARRDWLDLRDLQALATVDGTTNVLVHDLGTAERPSYRLLDPQDNQPFGPLLMPVSPADSSVLTALSNSNKLAPGIYPIHIPCELTASGRFSIAIPGTRAVHLRYKGQGVYDISIDGHPYRLDTNHGDTSLTRLHETQVGELSTIEAEAVLCRPRRELTEPDSCAAFTRLVSTPIEDLPTVDSSLNAGREASLAFECREFQLDRRTIAASSERSEQTLDVFVHEEKFCKWDYQIIPAKGRRRAMRSPNKKIIPLSAEECAALGLPEKPDYLPQIVGRMSNKRKFGLLPDTSENKAKLLNPDIPTVALENIVAGVADRRILRSVRYKEGENHIIYVEADAGHFYKAMQDRGPLVFTAVTDIAEINEYLRLAEQYRFVAERPYSFNDRDNIAKLLFNVARQKNDPDILRWALHKTDEQSYASYKQWCEANNAENRFEHFAQNILSSESSQINLVEEAKSIIPDWKQVAGRSSSERQHIAGILNNLLPVEGSRVAWPHLNFATLSNGTASAEIIGQQIKGSNLAFAAIRTHANERYVFYALSGGQKFKHLQLKGQAAQRLDNVTYIDARALMHGRTPDTTFTDLPVLRSSDKLHVVAHDRLLDSERLIATAIKETFSQNDIASLQVFTRYDTCRSCGGVVLPQLKIEYPGSDFSVTYLQHYSKW